MVNPLINRVALTRPLVVVLLALTLVSGVAGAKSQSLYEKFFGTGTHDDKLFKEIVAKLNLLPHYRFVEAYRNDTAWAFYSEKNRVVCWLKRYSDDETANTIAEESTESRTPLFRYGNLVGFCLGGDIEHLAAQVRYILVGSGEWRD